MSRRTIGRAILKRDLTPIRQEVEGQLPRGLFSGHRAWSACVPESYMSIVNGCGCFSIMKMSGRRTMPASARCGTRSFGGSCPLARRVPVRQPLRRDDADRDRKLPPSAPQCLRARDGGRSAPLCSPAHAVTPSQGVTDYRSPSIRIEKSIGCPRAISTSGRAVVRGEVGDLVRRAKEAGKRWRPRRWIPRFAPSSATDRVAFSNELTEAIIITRFEVSR